MPNRPPSPKTKAAAAHEELSGEPYLPYSSFGHLLGPKYTFGERIKILFGQRVVVHSLLMTKRDPGHKRIKSRFLLTKQDTLEAAVRELEGRL